MSFDPAKFNEEFKAEPNAENLKSLPRLKSLKLARYLKLEVDIRSTKEDILHELLLYYIEQKDLDESVLDLDEEIVMSAADMKEVELKRLEFEKERETHRFELEKKKLDAEINRVKLETEAKVKWELEKMKIEAETQNKRLVAESERLLLQQRHALEIAQTTGQTPTTSSAEPDIPRFDATKQVRMVPRFNEADIDFFFQSFEKTAEALEWPRSHYVILLQTVLKGKAQEIYASMTGDDCQDYESVKEAILKGYELVPEAYRQKFRNLKKLDKQTFYEYAQDTVVHFDRWCKAKSVSSKEDLKQLVLIENFKFNLPLDIKTYLDEKEVCTLEEAAKRADEYRLTHKVNFGGAKPKVSNPVQSHGNHYRNNNFNRVNYKHSSLLKNNVNHTNRSSKPNYSNNLHHTGFRSNNRASGPSRSSSNPNHNVYRPPATCWYCHGPSHGQNDCPQWLQNGKPCSKPTGRVSVSAQRSSFNEVNKPNFSQISDEYLPFVTAGNIKLYAPGYEFFVPIKILRDTGANQTLLSVNALPPRVLECFFPSDHVEIHGVTGVAEKLPLMNVELNSPLVSGIVSVGVIPHLPAAGISLLLGNDLARDSVVPKASINVCSESILESQTIPSSSVSEIPVVLNESKINVNESSLIVSDNLPNICNENTIDSAQINEDENKHNVLPLLNEISPTCAVTRSQSARLVMPPSDASDNLQLDQTFLRHSFDNAPKLTDLFITRKRLIEAQQNDHNISRLLKRVEKDHSHNEPVYYYLQNDVLMRHFRPSKSSIDVEWEVKRQIVLPKIYINNILDLAHSIPMGGHLGVLKTYEKVRKHFYWPGMQASVRNFCKTCQTCQMIGKRGHHPPPAPLKPIQVFAQPFENLIVDCVGPLPKTSRSKQYLLTIMCTSTRFPEAIPLGNIGTTAICDALTLFFSRYGLPKSIQSDNGSNFTSRHFKQYLQSQGIEHSVSSPYHPESQGVLERFHGTLKSMMRAYCLEHNKDWDVGIPLLLFAIRDSVQESLGFSPFELIFGHRVRGPLSVIKDHWLSNDESDNLLNYILKFKTRLYEACESAKAHLSSAQAIMKKHYDKSKKVCPQNYAVGEQVLVLLPVVGSSLSVKYSGPYVIHKKISDLDYVVKTPDRRKPFQLCHVNMLKKFYVRNPVNSTTTDNIQSSKLSSINNIVLNSPDSISNNKDSDQDFILPQHGPALTNIKVLNNLKSSKLSHLSPNKQDQVYKLVHDYKSIFSDIPTRTNAAVHDIELIDDKPIKQHPYRHNPEKTAALKEEVQYMLNNDLIEPGSSPWASPCLVVPKPDGSFRMVTDLRKVNSQTKADTYPIPRLDDCIDKVGQAQFVTKFDLLKGYWSVPLSDKAKEITAFVTSEGLYKYKVMPFGCKNASATYQRLLDQVTNGLINTEVYIDDVIIYSKSWEEHLDQIECFFKRLVQYNLTINLRKSDFGQATVVYLGHVVGQGQVSPITAKVNAINEYPVPSNKKALMRFLGMAGFYRRFCPKYSDIVFPLTNLLKKDTPYVWSELCDKAFKMVKKILVSEPVLSSPDTCKPFFLSVDASENGMGAVLSQADADGALHPISYYSRKFTPYQRRYSTIEKEALALITSLQHYDVYVGGSNAPLTIYTDHNPLTFVSQMKNKSSRLLRWFLVLQEYNVVIKHVRGSDNKTADALSRV